MLVQSASSMNGSFRGSRTIIILVDVSTMKGTTSRLVT